MFLIGFGVVVRSLVGCLLKAILEEESVIEARETETESIFNSKSE